MPRHIEQTTGTRDGSMLRADHQAPNLPARTLLRSGAMPTVSRGDRLSATRRTILEHLEEEGPTAVVDIPREWPLTRYHVRHLVRRLCEEGLIETESDAELVWYTPVRLTDLGVAVTRRFEHTVPERTVTLSRPA